MRHQLAMLLMIAAALSSGCATSQSRQVGDGTVQRFSYTGGVPNPARNDWVTMTLAGSAINTELEDVDNIPYWWNFGFDAKVDDIKTVTIYDVTEAPPRLVLRDTQVRLKDGGWIGQTEPRKLSRATAPWLYEPGPTEHIFKIVLTNSDKEERILYQPCLHGDAVKKALLLHIARVTAPKNEP